MIRETIVSALKTGRWSIEDAADQLEMNPTSLSEFCSGNEDLPESILDELCELLDLKLIRVFTKESWDAHLNEAWESWGSKGPSEEYAAAKAEEWEAYRGEKLTEASGSGQYEIWSQNYDEKEFDNWEGMAFVEFEKEERERLEKFDWIHWR